MRNQTNNDNPLNYSTAVLGYFTDSRDVKLEMKINYSIGLRVTN